MEENIERRGDVQEKSNEKSQNIVYTICEYRRNRFFTYYNLFFNKVIILAGENESFVLVVDTYFSESTHQWCL